MWNVTPIKGAPEPRYYVLDEENDLIATTEEGWRAGKAEGQHLVADEQIGDARVWTIFTGIDLSDDGNGPLFETHSLYGEDGMMEAGYRTMDEAVEGHKAVAERWRKLMAPERKVLHLPGV